MPEELSGEHKLRIVLESIIRNVPKAEQCQKYGISEEEFQGWHDHLITNGGKLFESDFGNVRTRVKRVRRMTTWSKLILCTSLLANLAAVIVCMVIWLGKDEGTVDPGPVEPSDSPLHASSVPPVNSGNSPGISQKTKPLVPDDEQARVSPTRPNPVRPLVAPKDELEQLLARPLSLPNPGTLPPVALPEPEREVSLMGKDYKGKHVVYLLDVGSYVLEGERANEVFESMKSELLSSIANLSPNSYFNMVLFWNLREASALGKTLLRANQENKKYAIDWLTGLGSEVENLKEKRNQYYPKELLFAKPLPGVVGFWYGLSTAISFDPDLVFVFAGNLPAFSLSEIPRSHFDELGIDAKYLSQTRMKGPGSAVNELIKLTARKWLISIERASTLPQADDAIDEVALQRLGFLDGNFSSSQMIDVPWEKSFEHFLSSLEIGFDRVPRVHTFVCLPTHVTWPRTLTNSVREFSESSKGSFTLNPQFP
jgi:hypothetical protein